jgi:hypothetical protein
MQNEVDMDWNCEARAQCWNIPTLLFTSKDMDSPTSLRLPMAYEGL